MNISDVKLLFTTLDTMIDESTAGDSQSMSLRQLRTILYLISTLYLRPNEVLGLNTDSFVEHINLPEFGKYGEILVVSNSSVSRRRMRRIINTDSSLPGIIEEHLTSVRPYFLGPGESQALFLSASGERCSVMKLRKSFLLLLDKAGITGAPSLLDFRKICLMRDSMVIPRLSATACMKGHYHFATTANYIPREEIDRALAAIITDELIDSMAKADSYNNKIEGGTDVKGNR